MKHYHAKMNYTNFEPCKPKKQIVKNQDIEEYPVKCLKLGNSLGMHFYIQIIPSKNKGVISLLNKLELTIFKYEFGEDTIKVIKEFLRML